MIKTIDIESTESKVLYKYLSSAITPRPIALVSTIDYEGGKNLSPFSFFNVFSITPPILVFSPVRRMRNNSSKDTLDNLREIKECVIALVTEEIVQQVSLTSCEFPTNINEFQKGGFTEIKSEKIMPPRIKESPINFECKVNEIIHLGEQGGAGSLVLCEVLKIHIEESILDKDEIIDPIKLNIISRLGKDWYGKTTPESIYKISKPLSKIGMGFDNLPKDIRYSKFLTGNELAMLASIEKMPIKEKFDLIENKDIKEKHILAKKFLSQGKTKEAWQILL